MSDEEENWEAEARERAKKRLQKTPNLQITVDRTPEMARLQDENADLKTKLTLVAEREFNRQVEEYSEKAEKLGIDVGYIEHPQQLEYLKQQIASKESEREAREKADPTSSGATGSAPLEGQYGEIHSRSGDLRTWEFESTSEMMDTLDELTKQNQNPELKQKAYKILGEMLSKANEGLKRGDVIEFQGDVSKLAKLQNKISGQSNVTPVITTPEEREKAKEEFLKEKSKWKKVK